MQIRIDDQRDSALRFARTRFIGSIFFDNISQFNSHSLHLSTVEPKRNLAIADTIGHHIGSGCFYISCKSVYESSHKSDKSQNLTIPVWGARLGFQMHRLFHYGVGLLNTPADGPLRNDSEHTPICEFSDVTIERCLGHVPQFLQQLPKLMPTFPRKIVEFFKIDLLKSHEKRMRQIKSSPKDVLRIQLLVKINAKWFREFLAFNPQPYLQKATIPLLAINGDQDVQADPEDINRMREFLTDDFDGRVIPGVNHILRKGGA